MINTLLTPTQGINFANTTQQADLARGVFIESLELTLDGVVDIAAGGGNSGTVVADGLVRLLRNVRVMWDNDAIVNNLSGRDLLMLTKAASKAVVSGTELSSAGVGSYPFSISLTIPFARPWLVNPFETVLPPLPIRTQFKIFVDWDQSVNAGAGSAAGSGVLVSGGDRVITFSTAPTLTIVQNAAQRGKLPWYLPYYSSYDSDQFAAANTRFQFRLGQARRFDSVFISPRQGSLLADADLLNYLSLTATGMNYYDTIRATDLRNKQRQDFPASTATDLNYFLRFASGGWLGNSVEPNGMVSPLFTFDVKAPSGTGVIHMLFSELITYPNLTLVQG